MWKKGDLIRITCGGNERAASVVFDDDGQEDSIQCYLWNNRSKFWAVERKDGTPIARHRIIGPLSKEDKRYKAIQEHKAETVYQLMNKGML